MDYKNVKQRLLAAEKLLNEGSTSREKFESIRTLLRGLHPKIDRSLASCSHIFTNLTKLQKGEIIELSAEALPEDSEEEKKRKKLLLLFIRSWKELKNEVNRVGRELESKTETESQTMREQVSILGRIISAAKGPFGIITALAVVVVFGLLIVKRTKPPQLPASSPTNTIKVIIVGGQKVRLSDVHVGSGSECSGPHYHANDRVSVTSLEGNVIGDPGRCGLGKVSDLTTEEVSAP